MMKKSGILLFLFLFSCSTVFSQTPDRRLNVGDMFMLLPQSVFPDHINRDRCEEAIKIGNVKPNYDDPDSPFIAYDTRNGYLSLMESQFTWEMCYWNMKDGRKLVAVNETHESGANFNTFIYENGSLTPAPEYNPIIGMEIELEDFFDFEAIDFRGRDIAWRLFNEGRYNLYYILPQMGTTLEVYLGFDDDDDFREYGYAYIKPIQFLWIDETWIKAEN